MPTTRTVNGQPLSADVTITKDSLELDQSYVTLNTTQSISGRKTFNDLASAVFKGSTGSEYCNINYD